MLQGPARGIESVALACAAADRVDEALKYAATITCPVRRAEVQCCLSPLFPLMLPPLVQQFCIYSHLLCKGQVVLSIQLIGL